ncbi:hypothetical protein MAPG_02486 [Magnaporthiopsis poae ATCC 64411]|uniref:DNA2/NAM7 helicase-like C-terminal domain-containing protein n=1 Tax=Magnaporthiopsis poae (strain ATCC 64411 / 73-15) TaxID=644358 RepID=A0A0C4DRH8_MAGP6|nr:hypothetical protein MAPG_02486 [Magnaporthiopsis poae ATCC 64411]
MSSQELVQVHPKGRNDGRKNDKLAKYKRNKPKDVALMAADQKVICCNANGLATLTKAMLMWKGYIPDTTSALGICLLFPRSGQASASVANEGAGFGHVTEATSRPTGDGDNWAVETAHSINYRVTLWLPRDGVHLVYSPSCSETKRLFGRRRHCQVEIRLKDGADVVVEGSGMPFRNVEDAEVESWVNDYKPIAHGYTLADILAFRVFHLVFPGDVAHAEQWSSFADLPTPFKYGYGDQHFWDVDRYLAQKETIRGHRFRPVFSHNSMNDLATVLTQAAIQDVLWIDIKAKKIETLYMSAYSVPVGQRGDSFYAIVSLPPRFERMYMLAFRRLSSNDAAIHLSFFKDSDSKTATAMWHASLARHPDRIPDLADHTIEDEELVLLLPGAFPSPALRADDDPVKVADTQNLHRALASGTGFIRWQRESAASNPTSGTPALSLDGHGAKLPSLPCTDLTRGIPERYLHAVMTRVVPEDHGRFLEFVSKRPLGLTLVQSAPGTGKTEIASVISALMIESVGKLFGSGPSDVAVTNFAMRFYRVTSQITDAHNRGLAPNDPERRRYKLVVRGYNFQDEASALTELLTGTEPKSRGHWALPLTPTFWLLRVLGSDQVTPCSDDESPALDIVRDKVVSSAHGSRLADFVAGLITKEEYECNAPDRKMLGRFLGFVVEHADALFTTPANIKPANNTGRQAAWSEKMVYSDWWENAMRCVAMDEAGAAHVADLYHIWGNRLLPCIMAGDIKQLTPTVRTCNEQKGTGGYINRFAFNTGMSALAFFSGMGMPTWRQRYQFRMATGMFELSKNIYPCLNIKDHESCAITELRHKIGVCWEKFLQKKFPNLKPPPPGHLSPLFLSVRGSTVYEDNKSKSKFSPDQVNAALDLLSTFVQEFRSEIGSLPENMTLLSPYQSNVEYVGKRRRNPAYAVLEGMPPSGTIDSMQGQEAGLVTVVFGTSRRSGPGFTADINRLNVAITRHMSGLMLVGDVSAAGAMISNKKGRGKGKMAEEPTDERIKAYGPDGEVVFLKSRCLRQICQELSDAGRVVTVDAPGYGEQGRQWDRGKTQEAAADKDMANMPEPNTNKFEIKAIKREPEATEPEPEAARAVASKSKAAKWKAARRKAAKRKAEEAAAGGKDSEAKKPKVVEAVAVEEPVVVEEPIEAEEPMAQEESAEDKETEIWKALEFDPEELYHNPWQ